MYVLFSTDRVLRSTTADFNVISRSLGINKVPDRYRRMS